MADALTSTVQAKISGTFTNTVGTAETASVAFALDVVNSLTDGTTASKADKVWFCQPRTLTGTTPEDIDMYDLASFDIGAGAGKDPHGNSYANAEMVGILVQNASSSTGNLYIGGKNATTAFNSFLAVAVLLTTRRKSVLSSRAACSCCSRVPTLPTPLRTHRTTCSR